LEELKQPIKEFIPMIENHIAKMLLYEGIVAYRDFDRALEIDPEFTAVYQSRDCILSPDCHTDLVTQNKEMVEHLAAISVEQFIKNIPVYQGI
jgi:hypothetical protein